MSQLRILYGFHAVAARLTRFPDSAVEIFCNAQRSDIRMQRILSLAQSLAKPVHLVDRNKLETLTQSRAHQGIAIVIHAAHKVPNIESVLENLDEPPLLLILDGITDPHNLGACLRVADAMGVHAVLAPKDKSASINETVAKVSCGASDMIPYIQVTNLARTIRMLKEQHIWIAGTALDGQTNLFNFTQPTALAWVLGAEGHGMRRLTRDHCDILVNIPLFGSVESLNVSVAAGVCLAESRRQRMLNQ